MKKIYDLGFLILILTFIGYVGSVKADEVDCVNAYKVYKICTECEEITEIYNECSGSESCSDEIADKYQNCLYTKSDESQGTVACSDAMKEDYQKCEARTCSEINAEYDRIVACDPTIKAYNECNDNNSCSDELYSKYLECSHQSVSMLEIVCRLGGMCGGLAVREDDNLSEELVTRHDECASEESIPDVEETCETITSEYEKCIEDDSCSSELTSKYRECIKSVENPDTANIDIILIAIVIIGAGLVGIVTYRQSKQHSS